MAELLHYDHVDISYNGRAAVRDVSFTLKEKEILGIVGESGSGKSTLIRAAMGLLGREGMVTRGDIRYRGRSLPDLKEKELRRLNGPEMAMIFQNAGASFCPIRTVGSQLFESMKEHGKVSKADFRSLALDLLEKIGFENGERILDSYPFELSGGMQQRVGIACAMLMHPRILLADEPTSALDVSVQKQVVEEMLLMRKLYGTSIIIVTHNIGVIRAMADRVLIMKDGQTVEYGETSRVLNRPEKAYTQKLLAAVPRVSRGRYRMDAILKVDNLTKIYTGTRQPDLPAVDHVSFSLQRGECLGLIGESGSGKTTIVNMITRLLDPTEGRIILDGADITRLKSRKLAKIYRRMQMVFQTPAESFDPRRTLGDGIGESLRNSGMSRADTKAEVIRLLKLCGLNEEFARRYPHQVSGGQCQRAAIARALAVRPGLLICDEATSALDVTVQQEILELLNEL